MTPPPSASVEAIDDTTGVVVPDLLTIQAISDRRIKAGKLIAGVASKSDVELFKGRGAHSHKKKAKQWDERLTLESASRAPTKIKSAAKYISTPGMINLGGGLPAPDYFPFSSYSFKVPQVGAFTEAETNTSGTTLTVGKHDLRDDVSLYDIATAFNYGQGTGSAQLTRWVIEHTELVHNPPYADWQSCLTVGSTNSLELILRMFANPGTYMLSEVYTFATAVEAAAALGIKTVGVNMDEQGMLPDSLDYILTNWTREDHNGAPKPFIMYVVPTGQNPTGSTHGAERRKAIYAVAQKHDLLIIEDEPYYFLQMQPYVGQDAPAVPKPESHEEFLRALVPSYLSLDTDGRVVRLDSFSKVIAPGTRVGWITAPAQIIDRFARHSDVGTQGPNGFAQLALFKLLDEHWGHGGYLDWLVYIRLEYSRRRNALLGACERHLPQEVVSWTPPTAGMFHWMEVDWRRHPKAGEMTLEEIEEKMWLRSIDNGSLLIRGSWFKADQGRGEKFDTRGEAAKDKMFFRATFAAAPEDKMEEAIRRFGDAVRVEFGLESKENGHVNGTA